MRAAIIAGLSAITLGVASPATAQQEKAGEQFFACVTQGLSDEYLDLVTSGDATASGIFWLNHALAGQCRVFQKGEPYFFRSTGSWGAGCYRPAGDPQCFFRVNLPRKKPGG